jgi:hypothetical protein
MVPPSVEDQTKGKQPEETREIVVGSSLAPPNVEDQTKRRQLKVTIVRNRV